MTEKEWNEYLSPDPCPQCGKDRKLVGDEHECRRPKANRAGAEIERLRAALRPFAEVARGQILNPSSDDWQRASAVYQNTADEQSAAPRKIGVMICPDCRGERRGFDGALCKRCKGNGQLDVVHG